jgi:hypothetical protein
LQAGRRDELKERLKPLGKKRTFIRKVDESEEELSDTLVGEPLSSKTG